MPEPSIHNILEKSFPKSNKEDWLRIASQELMEKKRVENLTWKVHTLDFAPYYDQSDVANLPYLKKYHYRHPNPTYQYAGGWENLPVIIVFDEKKANEHALHHLAAGADGVLFDVTHCLDCNIDHLLEKIDWHHCSVSFISSGDTKIATKILAYVPQKNYDPSKLTGSIFWKSPPNLLDIKVIGSPTFKDYHSLGLIIPPSSPIQEISTSLQQAVMVMDTMTDLGMEKESVFKTMSVSLSCDENFFITIAKLRAIRLLWYQLSQAFEIPHLPEDLHINVSSEKWSDEKFQPHGNMINNTTQALAAVLGGCNSLTLMPEEENNEMMRRMARNVSNILKEESHLDKVADAMAGAYAVENMVHELSQAAWKDFQNKLRE